jgi:transcriptional regulator of met regulon
LIQPWIKRLGRNHLLGKVVRVETLEEGREIERLRRQVRDLEHALAQTRMKELLAEAQFDVLCERQGIADVEGEKKKAAAELSRRRGKRPGDGPQQ